ncbi:hypothetical protein ALC60_11145, partial [Trachymyrmex zeteki]
SSSTAYARGGREQGVHLLETCFLRVSVLRAGKIFAIYYAIFEEKRRPFRSFASEPVAFSLPSLGVHQCNLDCQSGRPTAEVFIGTTNGRDSGYKSVLQVPMLVHRVVSANHRISSLRQDIVESVLFSGCSGCTPAFGGISAATSAWRAACLRKVKDSGLGMPSFRSPNDNFEIDRSTHKT